MSSSHSWQLDVVREDSAEKENDESTATHQRRAAAPKSAAGTKEYYTTLSGTIVESKKKENNESTATDQRRAAAPNSANGNVDSGDPLMDIDFKDDTGETVNKKELTRRETHAKITMIESLMNNYGMTEKHVNADTKHKVHVQHLEDEWTGFRLWCLRTQKSGKFQAVFGALIVINTITMGMEVEIDAKNAFYVVESIFTIFFLGETVIRIAGSPTKPWMDTFLMLDAFIVFITVLDNFILYPIRAQDSESIKMDLSFLASLRIFRCFRFVRIFRVIKFVRPLRVMLTSLAAAFKNLLWVSILLVIIFYFFALMFITMLRSVEEDHPMYPIIQNHFSSLGTAMLTCLEAMTNGLSWSKDIARPMLQHDETRMTGAIWIFYVILSLFALVNIIIGVFVEEFHMTASNDDEQLAKESTVKDVNIRELKETFLDMDNDDDGCISWKEFYHGLKSKPKLMEFMNVDMEDAQMLFSELDWQGEGKLKIDDFLFGIIKIKGVSKSMDMLSLEYQIKKVSQAVRKVNLTEQNINARLDKLEATVAQNTDLMRRHLQRESLDLSRIEDKISTHTPRDSSQMSGMSVPGRASSMAESIELQRQIKALRESIEMQGRFSKNNGTDNGNVNDNDNGNPRMKGELQIIREEMKENRSFYANSNSQVKGELHSLRESMESLHRFLSGMAESPQNGAGAGVRGPSSARYEEPPRSRQDLFGSWHDKDHFNYEETPRSMAGSFPSSRGITPMGNNLHSEDHLHLPSLSSILPKSALHPPS